MRFKTAISLFSILFIQTHYSPVWTQDGSKHKKISYFWVPTFNHVSQLQSKGWELKTEIFDFNECEHNHLNIYNQNMKQSVDLTIHRFCDSPKFRFLIINKEFEKIISDKFILITINSAAENKVFRLESFEENGIETLDLSDFLGKNIQLVFTIINPELFKNNIFYYE